MSRWIATLVLALFLAGCENFEFGVANFAMPVFPESAEVNSDLFAGSWHNAENGIWVKIEKLKKENAMRVHITTESDTMRFIGTAFGIDRQVFLDLVAERPDDWPVDRLLYFLPMHTVAKVRLSDAKMDFLLMDPFKLHDFLKQHPNVLPHVEPEKGSIAITATRLENYNFLKTHAPEIEGLFDLFEETNVLVRKSQ